MRLLPPQCFASYPTLRQNPAQSTCLTLSKPLFKDSVRFGEHQPSPSAIAQDYIQAVYLLTEGAPSHYYQNYESSLEHHMQELDRLLKQGTLDLNQPVGEMVKEAELPDWFLNTNNGERRSILERMKSSLVSYSLTEIAAQFCQLKPLQRFMDQGGEIDIQNKPALFLNTVLNMALVERHPDAQSFTWEEAKEISTILIERHSKPEQLFKTSLNTVPTEEEVFSREKAIIYSFNYGLNLIDAISNPEPLVLALVIGAPNTAQFLIEQGADTHQTVRYTPPGTDTPQEISLTELLKILKQAYLERHQDNLANIQSNLDAKLNTLRTTYEAAVEEEKAKHTALIAGHESTHQTISTGLSSIEQALANGSNQ